MPSVGTRRKGTGEGAVSTLAFDMFPLLKLRKMKKVCGPINTGEVQ